MAQDPLNELGAGLGAALAPIGLAAVGIFVIAVAVHAFGLALSSIAKFLISPGGILLILLAAALYINHRVKIYFRKGTGASKRLFSIAKKRMSKVPLPAEPITFLDEKLTEIIGEPPSKTLLKTAARIYEQEQFSPEPPPIGDRVAHAAYRDDLRAMIETYKDPNATWTLYTDTLINALAGFHECLPTAKEGMFVVSAKDLIADVPEAVRNLLAHFYAPPVRERGLFSQLRFILQRNLTALAESHLSTAERNAGKLLPPADHPGTAQEIIDDYLKDTPLRDLFYEPVAFGIPAEMRFSHTHIVAGTGHGKTQLIQYLIAHDLAQEPRPSLVVIDSQSDMIATLQKVLRNYILIDPRNAPQLNVFDINQERLDQYGPALKEQVLNGVIDLYDYLFGSLLGAELTRKQSVFFRYSLRLLLALPQSLGRNATILDLLHLMHDPKPYLPAIEKLSPIQKQFFEVDFFSPGFKQTKEQIRYRLNAILENDTFARMLCAPKNEVDMFGAMNSGKIVLVNTAKDYLKAERSSFLGRLFISFTMNAALERAAIPEHLRHPAFLYVDEASEYFDDNIDELLNQARKNKLGLVFSHQYLEQCTPALRASFASNTSIKFAGAVSDKDARTLASDMRTTPEFILSQRKFKNGAQFACALRGQSAVSVEIPFGTLESMVLNDAPEQEPIIVPPEPIIVPPEPRPQPAQETAVNLHHPDLPWKLEPEDWRNPKNNSPNA